jgi:hypothetical protein
MDTDHGSLEGLSLTKILVEQSLRRKLKHTFGVSDDAIGFGISLGWGHGAVEILIQVMYALVMDKFGWKIDEVKQWYTRKYSCLERFSM